MFKLLSLVYLLILLRLKNANNVAGDIVESDQADSQKRQTAKRQQQVFIVKPHLQQPVTAHTNESAKFELK
jgi:hypothetical protein